ncbi:unnamed protein product, partial [Owenia fusiformis]
GEGTNAGYIVETDPSYQWVVGGKKGELMGGVDRNTMLIEMNPKKMEQDVLVARTLLNPTCGTIPVLVSNLTPSSVILHINTLIAHSRLLEDDEVPDPSPSFPFDHSPEHHKIYET